MRFNRARRSVPRAGLDALLVSAAAADPRLVADTLRPVVITERLVEDSNTRLELTPPLHPWGETVTHAAHALPRSSAPPSGRFV